MKIVKKVLIVLIGFIFLLLFLLYGPFCYVRETLITTAMTTMHHQYLAKWFYSDETIEKVLLKHQVIETAEITDTSLIGIDSKKVNTKYEEQILRKKNELYKVIQINGTGYRGYLVAVYDPSRIHLAVSSMLGKEGELITTVAKHNKAKIVMNASGFVDPNYNGNGGIPHGIVIQEGKVVSEYEKAPVGGGMIGFTNENKFVLGKISKDEALDMGVRDAVEFGPFLIVNGKASFIKGNGGWGIAPRTAIGQRQDGIVLFLVIDGRVTTSIGANMLDVTNIMQLYGAYNAANLDGGSSTQLWINGKIVNKPVANGKNGLRKMPTFWIVK